MKEKIEEILEKAFEDRASESELEFLEATLSSEEIESGLRFYKDLHTVSEHHRYSDSLNYVRNELAGTSPNASFFIKNRLLIIVLVSLLAIISIFYLFNKSQTTANFNDIYASYHNPLRIEMLPVERGTELPSIDIIDVQDAYLSGNYSEVTQLVQDKSIEINSLYKSLALLELGEYNQAEQELLELKEVGELGLVKEIADWYLSLISVKKNDKPQAIERLELIINEKNHSYKDDALKLLRDLDRLK